MGGIWIKGATVIAKWIIPGVVVGLCLAMADPSYACNCPKEQMIKKYGTVSQLGPRFPLPPPLPAEKGGHAMVNG